MGSSLAMQQLLSRCRFQPLGSAHGPRGGQTLKHWGPTSGFMGLALGLIRGLGLNLAVKHGG